MRDLIGVLGRIIHNTWKKYGMKQSSNLFEDAFEID